MTSDVQRVQDTGERPAPVSRMQAGRYWLKLGFISFGGPAGQIAVLHEELVERRRWISEDRFLHALDFCMSLPGPEAQQLATCLGWLMHRTSGGIVAGGLFILPSLFILIALSWVYLRFGDVPMIAGVFYGIKPAVTALVAQAAFRIGSRALGNAWGRAIAAAAFVAIFVFDAAFPLIVLVAAIAGFVRGLHRPESFERGSTRRKSSTGRTGPALVDDDTPTPPHTRISWARFRNLLAAFAGIWSGALGGLAAIDGSDGQLTRLGWFFTKTAWMTVGGAYAVLPYVYQGAVDHERWLTPSQMMDGLALGETTPGPLIMVVAFVGFVTGWTRPMLGSDAPFVAGAVAATVVTFFSFLPSFFFILLGAPLIESTRGNPKFTAPLAGVTAAVVGVIANLAVFFAYHVLWPDGGSGRFDWSSAAIGLAAFIALYRYKVGVIPVVLGAGVVGLSLRLAPSWAGS